MSKNSQRLAAGVVMLALALVAGASPALAAWQWTKWYMPKEELIEASSGAAHPTNKRGVMLRAPAVAANVTEYGVPSVAYFQFYSNDGLQVVEIVPLNPGHCDQLLDHLIEDLGNGDRRLDGTAGAKVANWRDKGRGNLVGYFGLKGQCTLTYKMLAAP